MSQAPSMPLYCDAYLADTMHLSLEEHGAYLKLLMITWRNNGQPLPDDDARLARMLGITVAKWRGKIRPAVAPFFHIDSGSWRQKRLEKEWDFTQKNIEKQREKAKSRWSRNTLESNNYRDAVADAAGMPEGMHPSPSPSPDIKDSPTHFVRTPKGGGETQDAEKRRKGTRWPPDQDVPDEWINDIKNRLKAWESRGMAAFDVEMEAVKFANYWGARTGSTATKLDWHGTWVNWCLKAAQDAARFRPRSGGRP